MPERGYLRDDAVWTQSRNPYTVKDAAADPPVNLTSDTVDLPRLAKALYIEGGGTIRFAAVDHVEGESETWTVASQSDLAVVVRRVYASGTTATGIRAY